MAISLKPLSNHLKLSNIVLGNCGIPSMYMQPTSNKQRKRSGFTLLEIMIVLLIISILVMIAIPAYMNVRENSRERLCLTHLRHLQDAKDRWAMENKKTNTDAPTFDDLIPDYIKAIPQCPNSGAYDLKSVGENVTCTIPDHKMY